MMDSFIASGAVFCAAQLRYWGSYMKSMVFLPPRVSFGEAVLCQLGDVPASKKRNNIAPIYSACSYKSNYYAG